MSVPIFKVGGSGKKVAQNVNIEILLKIGLLLASRRAAATSDLHTVHRFKVDRCECEFTDLKKTRSLTLGDSLLMLWCHSRLFVYNTKVTRDPVAVQDIIL